MQSFIKVIAIKVHDSFYFEGYLHLLNGISVQKILSYRFRIDQVRSFTSELLKHYYLANVLNIQPEDLCIVNSELGKPVIACDDGVDSRLCWNDKEILIHLKDVGFSISHSGDYVMIAIADRSVGIDIEAIDLNIDVTGIGKMVFSHAENSLINNNANNFFLLWTKKEALFKAHGTGFINDYYNKTNLNIELIEENSEYSLYSQEFADKYYLSVCIL